MMRNGASSAHAAARQRGEYGFDAPYFPLIFGALSVAAAVMAAFFWWRGEHRQAMQASFDFVFLSANTASFVYTTRRGKFVEWRAILDGLSLRGDERVLDLGCGRGAVLVAVAQRMTTGQVTGIDIWSGKDQSGNGRDVTLRNAALEGVEPRVVIETGDMRTLPFADGSFDLVVSSLAIHNIAASSGRRQAITEAFRVLKPGGRLVIADIRATALYEETLRSLGATKLLRRKLGWRFWWGNPFAFTTLLTGEKSSA